MMPMFQHLSPIINCQSQSQRVFLFSFYRSQSNEIILIVQRKMLLHICIIEITSNKALGSIYVYIHGRGKKSCSRRPYLQVLSVYLTSAKLKLFSACSDLRLYEYKFTYLQFVQRVRSPVQLVPLIFFQPLIISKSTTIPLISRLFSYNLTQSGTKLSGLEINLDCNVEALCY